MPQSYDSDHWNALRILVMDHNSAASDVVAQYQRSSGAQVAMLSTIEQVGSALGINTRTGIAFDALILEDEGPNYRNLSRLKSSPGAKAPHIAIASFGAHDKRNDALQAREVTHLLRKPIRQSRFVRLYANLSACAGQTRRRCSFSNSPADTAGCAHAAVRPRAAAACGR